MPEVGIVIPAHACALGKALRAFGPDGRGEISTADRVPRSMTDETITDSTRPGSGRSSTWRAGSPRGLAGARRPELATICRALAAGEGLNVGRLGVGLVAVRRPAYLTPARRCRYRE